ncbi:hypothetical protein M885DRAFT_473672 [Pelagophyceae sp. CCMP2097]|nr:hypothetical protein M885DRAFT_473672 [Pelagophyceae sp. CCMP2097]
MGTSPRRVALFGLGGVSFGLASDLFGMTSALLSQLPDAARSARLDTYYSVGDFKRYVDDEFRFEFLYPKNWLGDQAVYLARTMASTAVSSADPDALLSRRASQSARAAAATAFGPPQGTFSENVSVFRSSLPRGFALSSLGEPAAAAQRLLDTAIAPPTSKKVATLVAARRRADFYEIEYVLELPGGAALHNLAVIGQRGDALVTLTVLCVEKDWEDRRDIFHQIADSFAFI